MLDSYNCSCTPGYFGKHCETEIDDCLPKPCLNQGECRNEINGYSCSCQPGYMVIHVLVGVVILIKDIQIAD